MNASEPNGPQCTMKKKRKENGSSLYPLQELKALSVDSSNDSESSGDEDLDPEKEAELE